MIEDNDPQETREWLDALDAVVRNAGEDRATYLMDELSKRAFADGIRLPSAITTPFSNTISPADQRSEER
ncbi:MAG: hypothetical protein RIC38_06095, partial [Chromatocurvus sp.]